MADKITNFEEYKKKELGIEPERPEIDHDAENAGEQAPKKVSDETTGYIPVTEHTMEIEIEDPFQFLDEKEREEYILQRQKERREAAGSEPDRRDERSKEAHHKDEKAKSARESSNERKAAKEQDDRRHDPAIKGGEDRNGKSLGKAEDRPREHRSSENADDRPHEHRTSENADDRPHEHRTSENAEDRPREHRAAEKTDAAAGEHAPSHKKEETPEERLRRRHNERIRQKPSRDEFEDSTQEEDIDKRKAVHTVEKGSAGGRTDRSGKENSSGQRGNDHHRKPVKEIRRDDYEEDDDYDEEVNEDDGSDDSAGIELVVLIASVITGIIILSFIALLVKTKIVDRYVVPEPVEDERVETVAIALPEGYTGKDDTVVVSGARSLNLRTVPSTGSDDSVAAVVSEGDELKRIAVSDDGKWALVDYDGQYLYVSMKYLEVR
ncbi:MAG: hypothetical protein IJV21_00955 [Lachnospiraceae bacterium]|nr:hypothetical protein [Lachnospiraceae bacterium]